MITVREIATCEMPGTIESSGHRATGTRDSLRLNDGMTESARSHLWKPLHVLDHSLPMNNGYSMRSAAIVREQRELGWKPVVATSANQTPTPASDIDIIDGVKYHRIVDPGKRRMPFVHELVSSRQLIRRLNRLVTNDRPDLIHAHSPSTCGFAALHVARRHGLPFVYEMRGLWQGDSSLHRFPLKYQAGKVLEEYVVKSAHALVAISQGLNEHLLERGAAADRLFVVPNGVGSDRFGEVTRDEHLSRRYGLTNQPTIGYLGSLLTREGLDVLVRAAKELAPRVRFKLIIAGSGPEEGRLKDLVRALSLTEIVVFTGRVAIEDLQRYYSIMDILVYPRRRNPTTEKVTPLKPLEAMALGKPIITSDAQGLLELLVEDTCRVFPCDNPTALANCCEELIGDTTLREALGTAAQTHARATRQWPHIISYYQDVYETAVANQRNSPRKSSD